MRHQHNGTSPSVGAASPDAQRDYDAGAPRFFHCDQRQGRPPRGVADPDGVWAIARKDRYDALAPHAEGFVAFPMLDEKGFRDLTRRAERNCPYAEECHGRAGRRPAHPVSVIAFRPYAEPSRIPTLVLIDRQQNMLPICAYWRSQMSPRHLQTAARRCLMQAPWVFRWPSFAGSDICMSSIRQRVPRGGSTDSNLPDMAWYSNATALLLREHAISDVMTLGEGDFVIAGFAGEAACLSTAIEAFHHNQRFAYLADASASHACERITAPECIGRLRG